MNGARSHLLRDGSLMPPRRLGAPWISSLRVWPGVSSLACFLGLVGLFSAGLGGCSCRRQTLPDPVADQGSPVVPAGQTSGVPTPDRRSDDETVQRSAAEEALEKERHREQEITTLLERSQQMLRSGNLDGAYRITQRLRQEPPRDPYVHMRCSYLQAMIFHRQNDPRKRKEAMNSMLQSMEAVQQDPRFQAAHEDGKTTAEMIKMTLDKAGGRYAN
jgi:hypothetical protein